MKGKSKLGLLVIILIIIVSALYGCKKDPYKNLSISLDKDSFEYVMGSNENDYFSVTSFVNGASTSQSKQSFFSFDNEIISLIDTKLDGNSTTATFKALKGGFVNIKATSAEGNKTASIKVSIIKPIVDFNLTEQLSQVVTDKLVLSEDLFKFYPNDTTQKELKFTLKDNSLYKYIKINNNEITIDSSIPSEINSFNIIALSIYNESIIKEFTIKIVKPILIKENDVIISNTYDREVINEVSLISNKENYSSYTLLLSFKVESLPNIKYYYTTKDIIEVEELGYETKIINNETYYFYKYKVQQNNIGSTKLTFYANYLGNQTNWELGSVDFMVKELPTSITINGRYSYEEAILLSDVNNTSYKGYEITIDVLPKTTLDFDSLVKLQFNKKFFDNIEIYNANSEKLTFAEENEVYFCLVNNGSKLYLKTKNNLTEEVFSNEYVISFSTTSLTNYNFTELSITMPIKIVKGVTSFEVYGKQLNENYKEISNVYLDTLQNTVVSFKIDNILPLNSYKGNFKVTLSNDNIVTLKQIDAFSYEVTPKTNGVAVISVDSGNGIIKNITVEVTTSLIDFTVTVSEENNNKIVGYVKNEEVSYENFVSKTLSKIAVIKGNTINLNIKKYPNFASNYDTTIISENENIITNSNSSTIYVRQEVLNNTVKVTTKYKKINEDGLGYTVQTITKSFELTSYIPIESLDISSSKNELYNYNSVGTFGYSLSECDVIYKNNNETYNKLENIKWSMTPCIKQEYDENNNLTKLINDFIEFDIQNLKIKAIGDKSLEDKIVYITARLDEGNFGNKIFEKEFSIKVKNAVTVENIYIENVEKDIYLDVNNKNFELLVSVYPLNARNKNVRYTFVPDEGTDQNIITISKTGQIEYTGTTGGSGSIIISAEDWYINSSASPSQYKTIRIFIGDGSKENPIRITNEKELLSINNEEGLTKHYLILNSISLSEKFTPLGYINENKIIPFTGSISFRQERVVNSNNEVIQEFAQGKISGLNINKLYYNNTSLEKSYASGLFMELGVDAEINDINLSAEINLTGTYYTNTYIGTITAINKGKIKDPNVVILNRNVTNVSLNSTIVNDNNILYIGLMVGYNAGSISFNKISNISINNNFIVSGAGKKYLGVIAGYNNKNINSENNLNISNTHIIYDYKAINYSDESYKNSCLGGVVGFNDNNGYVSYITTDNELTGCSNIGGICGYNKGNISNCVSSTVITGNNALGGISGVDEAVIYNCKVENYNRNNNLNYLIFGQTDVGGIVGLSKSSKIYLTSFSSFITKDFVSSGNFVGDLYITTNNGYVGGIIGKSISNLLSTTAVIDRCSFNGNIQVSGNENIFGGLVGYVYNVSMSITDSYSVANVIKKENSNIIGCITGYYLNITNNSQIINNCYFAIKDVINNEYNFNLYNTADNYTSITTNNVYYVSNVSGTLENKVDSLEKLQNEELEDYIDLVTIFNKNEIWKKTKGYNNSLPYILQPNGNPIIKIPPVKIEIEILETPLDNNFVKANYKDVVLFLYKSVNSEDDVYLNSFNTYDIFSFLKIKKFISLSTYEEAVNFNDLTFTVNNQNITISNNNIVVNSEGLTTLTVKSKLNENIVSSIEIFVCYKPVDFKVFINKTTKSENELTINSYLKLKKDVITNVYPTFINYQTISIGSESKTLQLLTSSNYAIKVLYNSYNNKYDSLFLNDVLLTPENNKFSLLNDINLLAVKDTYGTIYFTPSIFVSFSDESFYINFNNEDSLIQKFNIGVQHGATNISVNKENVSIMPENELEIKVTLKTNYFDDDILIKSIDGLIINNSSTSIIKYNKLGQILKQVGSEIFVYDNLNNRIIDGDTNISYLEKIIKVGINKNYFINNNNKTSLNLQISSLSNDLTKNIQIEVTPQNVKNIQSELYLNVDDIDDKTSSDTILPGKVAYENIQLFPYYSNFDYIDVLIEENYKDYLALEPVKLKNVNGNVTFENISNYSKISGGIRIYKSAFSLEEITANKECNIFIRLILSSNVQTKENITLVTNVYRESGYLSGKLFSYERSYYIENIDKITMELPKTLVKEGVYSDYFKTSTDEYYYLPINTEKQIIIDYDGFDSEPNFITKNSYLKVSKRDGKFYLSTYDFDKTNVQTSYGGYLDTLTAVVTKTVNGTNVEEKYSINVIIVDYVINGVMIENVVDNKLTGSIGNNYNLKVYLNTSYNLDDNSIALTINDFEKTLSNDLSNWYYQNKSDVKYFDRYYNFTEIVLSDFDTYKFNNFTLVNLKNNSLKATYQIKPANINNTDNIKFNCKYSYVNSIPKKVEENELTNNEFNLENYFIFNIFQNSDENSPTPIWNYSEFTTMLSQEGHYILMNDIVLPSDYIPFDPSFTTFDGNNKKVYIQGKNSSDEGGITYSSVFNKISSGQMVKNLKVSLDNKNIYFNFIGATSLTYGVLANTNNGIIYNCEVLDGNVFIEVPDATVSDSQVFKVSLFVCYNNGYITNSRVKSVSITSYGLVSGFVMENNGSISASYFLEGDIINKSNSTSTSQTSGFVVANNINGKINGCYVQGKYSYYYSKEDISKTFGADLNIIKTSGRASGFVFNNYGNINDCFADIKIESNAKASGFVFKNIGDGSSDKGIISNCYTTCVMKNNTDNKPFISEDERNNINNTGTISNCYYLDNSSNPKTDDRLKNMVYPVKAYYKEGDKDNLLYFNKSSSFENFAFSSNTLTRSGAVWFMSSEGEDKDFSNTLFRPYKPTLCSANLIASGSKTLDYADFNEETQTYTYYYIYENGVDAYGSKTNPIVLWNAENYNYEFTVASNNSSKTVKSYYRIVSDINFSGINSVASSSNTIFMGNIDGNNMTLSGFTINSSLDSFSAGLFKQISSDSSSKGCIKNLTLAPYAISASSTTCVGTLAGTLDSADLFNITINGKLSSSSSAVVQGRNLTGGLVGLATGNFQIIGVDINIYVNSSFRIDTINSSGNYTKPFYIYNDNSNITKISYAGGVVGVSTSSTNAVIKKVTINGHNIVLGEIVGGVAGLIGKNVELSTVKVYATSNSYLSSARIAGGIVGENRGNIKNAQIVNVSQDAIDSAPTGTLSTLSHTKYFTGNAHITGGLVGFNNGGNIYSSISKVDVINLSSEIVGGFVGRYSSGKIESCEVYGSVKGKYVMGGFIGAVTESSLLTGKFYNNIVSECETSITRTELNSLYLLNNKISNNWVNSYKDYYFINSVFINSNGEEIYDYTYNKVVGGYIGVIQKQSNLPSYYFFNKNTINKISSSIKISSERLTCKYNTETGKFEDSVYPLSYIWKNKIINSGGTVTNYYCIQTIGAETDNLLKLNVNAIIVTEGLTVDSSKLYYSDTYQFLDEI